ncbi:MAG: aldehyde dehydrogenase family protein [Sphingorhabdus sp.]
MTKAGMQELTRLFIDGEYQAAGGGADAIINPANEEVIGHAPVGNLTDLDTALSAARAAVDQGDWAHLPFGKRADIVQRFVDELRARGHFIQRLLIEEAGSTLWLSQTIQFAWPLNHADYAIQEARKLAPESLPFEITPNLAAQDGSNMLGGGVVELVPAGVVAAITPYNFPFFLNVGKVVPALLMGNSVVLKPSPYTPFAALVMAEAARAAGLPKGLLNIITGGTDVGAALTSDPRVDLISFTGSDTVGAAIMAQASPGLKRVHLELGGKSALIVRADANLQAAAMSGFGGFTLHSGQGCALLTRHIVHNSIRPAYVEMLKAFAGHTKFGDPADPATTQGPLIREAQRARAEHFTQLGLDSGAKLVFGGKRPAGFDKGFFYEPTLFDDVDNKSRLAQEEVFGPVGAVIGFDTDDEAIALANDSQFGLSGAIYSADVATAFEMARRLRTGDVSINGGAGKMSSHAPFGGMKRSGIGREYGKHWLREFAEERAILFHAG